CRADRAGADTEPAADGVAGMAIAGRATASAAMAWIADGRRGGFAGGRPGCPAQFGGTQRAAVDWRWRHRLVLRHALLWTLLPRRADPGRDHSAIGCRRDRRRGRDGGVRDTARGVERA